MSRKYPRYLRVLNPVRKKKTQWWRHWVAPVTVVKEALGEALLQGIRNGTRTEKWQRDTERVYIRRRTAGSRDFNLRSLRPSQKLDHVKYGAFPVVRKLENDNYELQLPSRMKIHPVFHISLLEPTKNPRNKENEMITEEQEWEVERVIGKRIRKGSVEYKVRWTGYESEDDTWEPVRHLHCPEKITEFEKEP